MSDTKIVLHVHGKRAEMTLEDAQEMFEQLKKVFEGVQQKTPTLTPWNPPDRYWLRDIWCASDYPTPASKGN